MNDNTVIGYNIGDRWIWQEDEYRFQGYIESISENNIVIRWETGRIIQYTYSMIEEEPRLKYDIEWHRNQKLIQLGI